MQLHPCMAPKHHCFSLVCASHVFQDISIWMEWCQLFSPSAGVTSGGLIGRGTLMHVGAWGMIWLVRGVVHDRCGGGGGGGEQLR